MLLFPAMASAANAPPVFFPGTNMALEDGDIILSSTLNSIDVLNRVFGYPSGPYTHATLFLNLPDKGPQLLSFQASGLLYVDPAAYMARAYKMALVRLRPGSDSKRIRDAFTEVSRRKLEFDFDMRWPAIDSPKTYCVGLISQIFRVADLPDPFPFRAARPNDFWSRWGHQTLNLDLAQIVSPNAVLAEKTFEVVATYQNPAINATGYEAMQNAVVNRIEHYLDVEKRNFAAPSLGDLLVLRIAKLGLVENAPILSRLPPEKQRIFVVFNDFMESVTRKTFRTMARDEEAVWSEKDVTDLTESIADAYRDRYFVSP
ncbi:MAG: hypothetical protein IPI58_04990 [Alphaproteobacteria bacterium]|nr:MAG: hypothetical protein IPI58_04990 [Alphaproteobacteria bacterium]